MTVKRQVLGLAACSVLILLCAPAQYFGRQHDDLLYFIAAQALSQGSYGLLTTPGFPPLVMLTPGFPLALLPLALIFGEWVPAYQAFSCLVLAASPWFVWAWLRRVIDPWEAWLIAMIFGTSPFVLAQAGTVMTEGAYTVLTILLLWAVERSGARPKPRAGRAGLLLLALTQLRPAGLSALPAAIARPFKEKRWKDAAWTLGPTLLGAAAWCLWSYAVSGQVQETAEFALSYRGQPLTHPLAVASDNARYYLTAWGSTILPAAWGSGGPALLAGTALGVLVLAGLRRRLADDVADPAALLLVGAILMHAIWAWQYERYLICLLPWLLLAVATALKRGARPVLAAMLALQCVFHSHRFLKTSAWSYPELARTYERVRPGPGSPPGLLASPLYVRDGYYTGRPSVPLPSAADPEGFARTLRKRRVAVVLWQGDIDIGLSMDGSANLRRELERAGRHLSDRRFFKLLYDDPVEKSKVYGLE